MQDVQLYLLKRVWTKMNIIAIGGHSRQGPQSSPTQCRPSSKPVDQR